MAHSHAHHHGHHHGHGHHRIGYALVLNLGFAVAELVGGFLTGSVAILADALHDFGDSLTLAMAFVLQRLSRKGRSREFSYGYARLSLLSALITGVVLSAGSLFVIMEALPRLREERLVPHTTGMIAFAVLGVLVNGYAAYRLSQGGSHNERMLTWHLLEDLFGWVAVLIGAFLIHFTGWAWIDPALAIGLSLFILYNVGRNLLSTGHLFLQGVPPEFKEEEFREKAGKVEGVSDVHDVHAWSLDGENNVLSLHIVIHPTANALEVKKRVRAIAAEYGNFHTTIEIEGSADDCADDCDPGPHHHSHLHGDPHDHSHD